MVIFVHCGSLWHYDIIVLEFGVCANFITRPTDYQQPSDPVKISEVKPIFSRKWVWSQWLTMPCVPSAQCMEKCNKNSSKSCLSFEYSTELHLLMYIRAVWEILFQLADTRRAVVKHTTVLCSPAFVKSKIYKIFMVGIKIITETLIEGRSLPSLLFWLHLYRLHPTSNRLIRPIVARLKTRGHNLSISL